MDWNILNNILSKSKKVLLSTHVNPDGDGLGSEIAFSYYLDMLGINNKIINSSDTPKHLSFIDPDKKIEVYDKNKHSKWLKNVDVSIAFDIGDCKRLNDIYKQVIENNIYSI